MRVLFELLELIDWLKPRRRDDPFTARCRAACREVLASTACVLLVLAVGAIVGWQLGSLALSPSLGQAVPGLLDGARWVFFAALGLASLRAVWACWSLFALYHRD
jgi:hypothetical protein